MFAAEWQCGRGWASAEDREPGITYVRFVVWEENTVNQRETDLMEQTLTQHACFTLKLEPSKLWVA